jgi:hypothetical protein
MFVFFSELFAVYMEIRKLRRANIRLEKKLTLFKASQPAMANEYFTVQVTK